MAKSRDLFPKTVSVLDSDGTMHAIPYKEILRHEENIIEDNICEGLWHGYTSKEICEYKRSARAELRGLKAAILNTPNVILTLDRATERYIVAPEQGV